MKYYREKLSDLRRCFAEGKDYSVDAFGRNEYLQRLERQNAGSEREAELKLIADLVRPHPGLRVLDFGCGLGRLCARLSAGGCIITGADVSSEILRAARSGNPGIRFVSVDEAPENQDVIVSMHVLGHVPNPLQTLRRMHDLLACGGRLVFSVPNPAYTVAMIPSNAFNDYLPDTTILRCWSKKRMRSELRKAGFSDIVIRPWGSLPNLFRFESLRSRLIGEATKC